jgi:hypothetical protein
LVSSLEGPAGITFELPKMLGTAADFYKNLFHSEGNSGFKPDPDFFALEEKLNVEHNVGLEALFT